MSKILAIAAQEVVEKEKRRHLKVSALKERRSRVHGDVTPIEAHCPAAAFFLR